MLSALAKLIQTHALPTINIESHCLSPVRNECDGLQCASRTYIIAKPSTMPDPLRCHMTWPACPLLLYLLRSSSSRLR